MKVVILASGSKGNATYIETQNTKLLIDAGISYQQIKNRLAQRNIVLNNLDAILVTHEHTDHVKYLVSVATRTNATIYMSEPTYYCVNQKYSGGLGNLKVGLIKSNCKYELNDLIYVPLELSHDASSCYGYVIKEKCVGNATYGYITDTGYIPEQYLSLISRLQVISLESNHDVAKLKASKRPWPLIKRILSTEGHLSNLQCSNYLKDFDFRYVKIVILSHLSEECNSETLAMRAVNEVFDGDIPCELLIAKQDEPLDVIEVK